MFTISSSTARVPMAAFQTNAKRIYKSAIRGSSVFPAALSRRCLHVSVPSRNEEKVTHFGFKTVPEDRKEEMVGEVFRNVASKYDVMNDAMSLGVHRLWKDHFMRVLSPGPQTELVDVAGGTGDIAFRFLDHVKAMHGPNNSAKVTVVDINPAMLEVGKERAAKMNYLQGNISFVEGNAENLSMVPDSSVDAFTIAFGIRNCTHVDRVVQEAYRVLRPGGRFMCLEFGRVDTPIIKSYVPTHRVFILYKSEIMGTMFYDIYSFQVIPAIGQAVANDRESYQYLVESIRKFPPQPEFAKLIQDTGFTLQGKGWEDLTFGVAAIHSGFKL
ncbi:2-hexaprenyl-6-methoxy-1,4-benzoquinone methyltransferase [Blyttiomyces sp. JEL0837]|nr:2-hexaprenyl-6-methoxy-1,4-benzoquinone methyltransferase [Blyttiomyces sp. JEL0837]